MDNIERKSLADEAVIKECRERIAGLNFDSRPSWGLMSPAQMLAHCAEVLEVAAGKELKGTPWFIKLFRSYIRKAVVGPKPFPRSTKTHPQYLQDTEKNFDAEKTRILTAMDAFVRICAGKAEISHPFFGEMTVDEAGWGMYKHLDHHLEQFGV